MKNVLTPISERFWLKVSKGESADDCWSWTGGKNEHGYGIIGRGRRGDGFIKAHRLSWELHYGDVPDGLCVLHRCDNPECTNTQHLFLGTKAKNSSDMSSKGRAKNGTNQHSFRRSLSITEVREMRRLFDGGMGVMEISRSFNIEDSRVSRIVRRISRREE